MIRVSVPAVSTALIIGVLFSSCSETTQPGVEFYVVGVDSLVVPDTVAADDTLTIKLWGIIGPNSCYSFSHFESVLQPSRLDLTVWGKFIPAVSYPVMIEMHGKEYCVVPHVPGPFLIVVHQPDNSALLDTVQVQ